MIPLRTEVLNVLFDHCFREKVLAQLSNYAIINCSSGEGWEAVEEVAFIATPPWLYNLLLHLQDGYSPIIPKLMGHEVQADPALDEIKVMFKEKP